MSVLTFIFWLFFLPPPPVEWNSFGVTAVGRQVLIYWATSKEQNNQHFTVLRSHDGDNFEPIAVIDGKGTTVDHHYYSFLDARPYNTRNYYRIRQVDSDSAAISYTEVLRIDVARAPIDQALLYPNPCDNIFYIELPIESVGKEVIIQLVDANAVVQQTLTVPRATVAPIAFDNQDLINGKYWVHILYDKKRIVKPVWVAKLY